MDPNLDARASKRPPERARSLSQGTYPVVDDSHADAFACSGHERLGELPPDFVILDEIVLEVNVVLRRANRREPRGIVLRTILEQAHLVSADERRTRGAREHPIGELAKRWRGTFVPFFLARRGAHASSLTILGAWVIVLPPTWSVWGQLRCMLKLANSAGRG